jgi:hypothetical protein
MLIDDVAVVLKQWMAFLCAVTLQQMTDWEGHLIKTGGLRSQIQTQDLLDTKQEL